MTFSPSSDEALFNLVVRGLAFGEGHLLVSRWTGGYCFPVGGRLDHGETLEEAIRREFREETGVSVTVRKLVYFNENFFVDDRGKAVHELGWYFWMALDAPVGAPGVSLPHPDSPKLALEYLDLERLDAGGLFPPFLRRYLPGDFAQGFSRTPRHIVSRDQDGEPPILEEIRWRVNSSPSDGRDIV
jgi:ADP-ribose pyrophosphatase YjhB (NUDIX family)